MNPPLTPQQWRVVEQLFHAACEVVPAARDALVHDGSAGDAEIARVVRRLLAADAEPALLDAGIDAMVEALFTN